MDQRPAWRESMVKIYIEGGGDYPALKTACRQGFAEFFKKAGFTGKMPAPIACGSRLEAYKKFCIAIKNGENALLLVDSESAVSAEYKGDDDKLELWQPWTHLAQRDGDKWQKPEEATNDQCHLMVQCMENWFLADRESVSRFFANGFNENSFPRKPIELIDKTEVYNALEKATKNCKTKAKYGKGEHSFKILKEIDPHKITAASPWAKRFVNAVKQQMNMPSDL